MAESAAFLVDEVFPQQPIRQWVFTLPFELRFLLASHPRMLGKVLAVVNRAISAFIVRHSGLTLNSGARTGAVTLVQRFGSALNLNVHLHILFLDGAYEFCADKPAFNRMASPSQGTLQQLLESIVDLDPQPTTFGEMAFGDTIDV